MPDAVIGQPPQARKTKQKRINVALAGVIAATTSQDWDAIAPQVGAKNGEVLRRVLIRKGVTRAMIEQARNREPVHGSVTAKLVSEATGAIQDMLNDELRDQIRTVRAVPLVYDQLANEKQGRAGLVKQIAESFRAVNGNPDSITFSFGASQQSLEPVIERTTPQPVVDCVSDPMPDTTDDTPPVQPV